MVWSVGGALLREGSAGFLSKISVAGANDTLVLWEDGNLTSALGRLPLRALSGDVPGTVVVYGKEGRPQDGVTDLSPLLRNLKVLWANGGVPLRS